MPLPAVLQLIAPGSTRCAAPVLSRCIIAPSNRQVNADGPLCGCGRTSWLSSGGLQLCRRQPAPHKSLRCSCRICTTDQIVTGSAPSGLTRPNISDRAQGGGVYRRSESVPGPPHGPAPARYWPKGARNGARHCIRCERKQWWARQGLNLRPHPCEGDWQSRVTTLFLRDKIKPRNCPCTRFVRRSLVYRLAVCTRTSLASGVTHSTRQVLAKYGWSDGERWPPHGQQKPAGRAATLSSGSLNSCATMRKCYRCGDSHASAILAGEVL